MLTGEPARRQVVLNPQGTATGFKRRMGTRTTITLRDRSFSPEQLSAFLLQKIKRDAEAFLGEPVDRAVVTVPAYFDDNQRSATKDAAGIAGLEVVRLVNEPTAASLAYGLDRLGEELCIAVVDLGGGTLDVTILDFGKGVFEVKATSGDTQLGGTDMDTAIIQHLVQRFAEETGVDVSQHTTAMARLREAAEMAKIELSAATTARVSLPYLADRAGEPVHLDLELTRTAVERLVRPVIERCRPSITRAVADAKVSINDINRLVFVGGPTRMPVVRTYFEDILGRKAEQGVDPMECVASGAAIQAGVLTGEVSDIVLVDVTPLTLGVETLGGVATPLVARNTPIPVRHTEAFTTASDMQPGVTIHVFQGERPMASDNTSLGEFTLGGIPPAARGVPKIDVTFDIDANGILDVTAKDSASGRSQSIRISGSTRLPEDEKKRMLDEAETYAEADRKRREDADKLNNADAVAYQAERTLAEFDDRLTGDLKQRITTALQETRDAHRAGDADTAQAKAAILKTVLQEAGTALYAEAAQTARPGQATPTGPSAEPAATGEPRPTGAGPRGKVIDAEYHQA